MMKKLSPIKIGLFPLFIWFAVIPVVVKVKIYENPLLEEPWYSQTEILADFFLYYKSLLVTCMGVLMLVLLCTQIGKMKRKDHLFCGNTYVFVPLILYLILAICSSLFSANGSFCLHGMPDQFENIWNIVAYVVAVFYCYFVIVFQKDELSILKTIYFGAGLVGLICVFQFFKLDLYRFIYADDGYTFTFAPGQVYGPFYNINYVGYYTLLFAPLFLLILLFGKNMIVRMVSALLFIMLIIALVGAESSSAVIAFAAVFAFAVLFLLIKHAKNNKILWVPIAGILLGGIVACVALMPYLRGYIQSCDTERRNLECIYTRDDYVEINYKTQTLYISMKMSDTEIYFDIKDQNQSDVPVEYQYSPDGYYYYVITDERFDGIELIPVTMPQETSVYGFTATIDDKKWCFTNQMTDDGTYYYFTDQGRLAKLTEENVSSDFSPLTSLSSLANGRGYIWNKTIAILKDYIVLGSGADTFTIVYPNNDIVDKYNNGYDNMFITKPHNLYLQIAVQSGVLSLICFLIFYVWYFISSLKIYFSNRLDNQLTVTGFAIMLGTLGYMISGLANDSTITVSPLYWALMGIGIGINYRIQKKQY